VRTMYDAIFADDLPEGGDLYAGYVDGKWPDANAISERFPHVPTVRIATSPSTNAGIIGDGPPDNGTWPQWVEWVKMRRAAGADPTINTNASSWAAGIAAFKAAGVTQPHWWIADYDGNPTIPAGAIGKQYASNDFYDTSSVAAYWPGVDPAPTPPKTPAAPAPQEDDVTTYYPIQVGPDPAGAPNACGVATWPAGAAHVMQILADPGVWQDTTGTFRLVFNLSSGPDVEMTHIASPGENVEIEFASVPGLNRAICRGVTITRPDGKRWPWGGGAA